MCGPPKNELTDFFNTRGWIGMAIPDLQRGALFQQEVFQDKSVAICRRVAVARIEPLNKDFVAFAKEVIKGLGDVFAVLSGAENDLR